MANRVVVIGLDGATFDLLGPWIETGLLPCLKRMIDEGVSGELCSCIPPVTAPTWTARSRKVCSGGISSGPTQLDMGRRALVQCGRVPSPYRRTRKS